jgi:hypothetical protein
MRCVRSGLCEEIKAFACVAYDAHGQPRPLCGLPGAYATSFLVNAVQGGRPKTLSHGERFRQALRGGRGYQQCSSFGASFSADFYFSQKA